jgi:O-antigen ligase
MTRILLLVFLYLGYCVFVGIHTFFLYGFEMATKGFMRFVNVALLAPLVATMISHKRQLAIFINIWLVVAGIGAVSGVYQFMGGDMSALTGGYGTSRGEAMRFMTLLGEPNVGGMASSIVLLLAVFIVRNRIWGTVIALVAIVLLFLSVSKAALVGFALAILLIILLQSRRSSSPARSRFQRTALSVISLSGLTAIFMLILSFSIPDLMKKVQVYAQSAVTAFSGRGDRYEVSPSFVDDLSNRLFTMTSAGIKRAKEESSFYMLDVVWGSSFGIAGTAAEEVRGPEVTITPHNGYSETFFIGGVLMLLLFLVMLFFVFRRLWWLSKSDDVFAVLLASFILCTAFMMGYPIMSTIFVGSMFWLAIGVAANRSIAHQELLVH